MPPTQPFPSQAARKAAQAAKEAAAAKALAQQEAESKPRSAPQQQQQQASSGKSKKQSKKQSKAAPPVRVMAGVMPIAVMLSSAIVAVSRVTASVVDHDPLWSWQTRTRRSMNLPGIVFGACFRVGN